MHTRGFSLIELLVVVAIIGVLAAAGIVGYQSYTTTAQNNVLDSNMNTTLKAARSDIQALAQGIEETSELFESVVKNGSGIVTCEEAAIELVEYLNTNYSNPHNSSRQVAAYGNAAVTGSPGTTFISSVNTMDRQGVIFVNCNEPQTDITNLDQVKLYQCGCETSDCAFSATQNFNDPTICPAPNQSTSSAAVASGTPFFGWN